MQIRNGIVLTAASMLCSAVVATAQTSDSALYTRAQQMVSNGDAAAGRALVDSLLGVAPSGSPRYAEALYWRATLAGSAADAERSYRQIVVDYPLSPRVDDALLRMGQLELTRGDREAALQHFQRITVEHSESPLRAKASYWTARVYLEKNDLKRACAANADALAKARPSDVELRNQIEFQNQRCQGVAVATPVDTASAAGESPAVSEKPADPEVDETEAVKPAPKPVSKGAVKSTAKGGKPTPKPTTKPETAPAEEETAVDVPKAPTVPPKPTKPTTAGTGKYAVQVAAYYDRPQADALAAKLRSRGYVAHVDGTAAPFRVRIGHYATRAQAATALENMKAKKMAGFVTPE